LSGYNLFIIFYTNI